MSPTQRWQAVLARDRRFDGAFVYAVRSTGIYCRPSCASRRPRRTQVTFYPIPEAAEREGYRACRRCHPSEVNGADATVAMVREACRTIDAGYGSTSRVYERTHAQLGMTPATYARGGAGVGIAYVTAPTSLGRLLVAATERGVCRVSIGDSTEALVADLLAEFPDARVVQDKSGKLHGWVTSILAYLDGREPHLDLPLDIRASAFQRRVWQELQRIPFGETRTYAEVAKQIGQPKATRAVARACATNPAALIIPCHRVVREDGARGGERKEALLEMEQNPT